MTFDMENTRHVLALAHFDAQPSRLKSEYVIDCILKNELGNQLEDVVRESIVKALADVSVSALDSQSEATATPTENLSDLPHELIHAMDSDDV